VSSPGRRDNGLGAPAWSPLGDVDPRVADAVLATLAAAGVAAWAEPSTGRSGAYLDQHAPRRPVDRLWVDAGRRGEAERLVHDQLAAGRGAAAGGPPPVSTDDAFAAIVAGWGEGDPARPPRSPGTEPPDAAGAGPDGADRPAVWRGSTAGSERQRPDPDEELPRFLHELPPAGAAEEGHYVPPPPPPVPRPRGRTLLALLAIVIGIAILVTTTVAQGSSSTAQVVGVLLVLGGATVLVGGLRDSHDDEPWDDGAQV